MPKAKSRRGATLLVVLVLLTAALLLSTLVLQASAIQLARVETQIAVDASSRAAGKRFALTGDAAQALAAARRIARSNPVAGRPLQFQEHALQIRSAALSGSEPRLQDEADRSSHASVRLSHALFTSDGLARPAMLASLLSASGGLRPVCAATSTSGRLDIALAIDCSRSAGLPEDAASEDTVSMQPPARPGVSARRPDRGPAAASGQWQQRLAAADELLAAIERSPALERVSLVLFADRATEEVPLTADHSLIRQRLHARGETREFYESRIGEGILAAAESLVTPLPGPAAKVIVLMSDGRDRGGIAPEAAAAIVADAPAVIFTVTFSDLADCERMQRIAAIGAGKHFHLVDGQQMRTAYREVARSLPLFVSHDSPSRGQP